MSFPPKRGQFREGSLDQYLKEISQYPLIDRAEEVRLAKAIHLSLIHISEPTRPTT